MTGSPDAAPTPVKALGADTPPKVGEQVEVRLRGVVVSNVGNGFGLRVAAAPGSWVVPVPPGVSVEVLTPPTPTWEAGDVGYDTSCDQTWFRSVRDTWIGRDGREHDDGEFIERCEWTLLVRDGKVVAP